MVKRIVCFLCYLTIFFGVCFGNQPLEPQSESVIRLSGKNVKTNKIMFAKIRSNHKKKHFHTSKCTWSCTKFVYYWYIRDSSQNFVVQLNKYQTDLYLLELSHKMTNVCWLISDFLPALDCSCMHLKLFCTSKTDFKSSMCYNYNKCRCQYYNGLLSKLLNNYSSQNSQKWIKLKNKTYVHFCTNNTESCESKQSNPRTNGDPQ